MSLKRKIQLWLNVQLWTYRPHLEYVCGVCEGKFSYFLMELVVNFPAPPGSRVIPKEEEKELLLILGGPPKSFQATRWWWVGVEARLAAWAGLWRDKAETWGWSEDAESEIKYHHLDH